MSAKLPREHFLVAKVVAQAGESRAIVEAQCRHLAVLGEVDGHVAGNCRRTAIADEHQLAAAPGGLQRQPQGTLIGLGAIQPLPLTPGVLDILQGGAQIMKIRVDEFLHKRTSGGLRCRI